MQGPDIIVMTTRRRKGIRTWAIFWAVICLWAFCHGELGAFKVPDDGFLPGWVKDGRPRVFQKMDLFNHIDGGAELFLEFGFEKLTVQRYLRSKADLILEIYEMDNTAAALGLYLMKCGRETPWPEFGARNSFQTEQAIILKGRFIFQVDNLAGDDSLVPAMKTLAGRALSAAPGEPAATLLDRLPAAGKIPGSERLVRGPLALQQFFTFGEGDILSLGGRIFGIMAEYENRPGAAFTRLIVPYESGPSAASALAYLRGNLDPYIKIIKSGPDGFSFEDFSGLFGRVERSGNELDIRFRLTAAE